MLERKSKRVVCFRQLWQIVRNELVQNVPDEIAICEFNCRRTICSFCTLGSVAESHVQKGEADVTTGL